MARVDLMTLCLCAPVDKPTARARTLPPVQYVIAQVLGGIAGAAILYVVTTGRADAGIGSFATNGYGEQSPGEYGLLAAALIEVAMTFGFVTVILASPTNAPRSPRRPRRWRSVFASP